MSNKISVFYNPLMLGETKSFSPSALKPKLVMQDWHNNFSHFLSIENIEPLHKNDFYLAHDKNYVDGIFNGTLKNGFGIKDSAFSQTFLYTNASFFQAAQHALIHKIAVSPTSGFHHAHYCEAEGYCTFNGLMITAIKLKKDLNLRQIGILDFDMHYGNGTDDIINSTCNDYVVHYTAGRKYDFNFPLLNLFKPLVKYFYTKMVTSKKKEGKNLRQRVLGKKANKFLEEIPDVLECFKNCDIILYQAGADQHFNDPYGGLLSYEQMFLRDKMVFEFAKKHNIPLVWNLAGGYQRDEAGTIEPVLKCHRNTMQACIDIYS
jgi:acetoin utilization deacetylase AcuC-like enzyme